MKIKFEHWLLVVVLYLSDFTLVSCNSSWLKHLPDSQRINTLSLIGTHDSATHKIFYVPLAWTQSKDISKQLELGVRVFDMRVRLIDNVFTMHHDVVFLGIMFGEILNDISAFLTANPKEFIIMFMQEEWTRQNTTMTECQILENKYIHQHPDLFVKYWSVNDNIGQHRGKILLAKGNNGFNLCTTILSCKEQNHWEITSNYSKNDKWNDIISLQDEIFTNSNDQKQCYINYLSANGGLKHSPMNICCKSQNPLKWLIGASPSNPGMNDLMLNYFRNPKNTLYILMADFPSPKLINKIMNSNY